MRMQQGIGFWGWSSILGALALVTLFGLRLFPLYNEKLQVDTAMHSLSNRPDAATMSTRDLRKYFVRNAQIGGTDRFNSSNIKDYLKVNKTKKGQPKTFTVKYEARVELFDVIYLLIVYDNTLPLGGSSKK